MSHFLILDENLFKKITSTNIDNYKNT